MTSMVSRAMAVVFFAASTLSAQNTTRWNDVVRSLNDQDDDPPVVTLILDRGIVNYGDHVRVGFRVEEDAFVVVGRVDPRGNLTVLFPSGRGRDAWVRAGEDRVIRGARTGALGTFRAVGNIGESGYVFAMASRNPIDLTRLQNRDFSAWVTGVNRGQPSIRYIGDPHRVIQRFARLVLFNPDAEDWDYDIAFYAVDQPSYVGSSYVSSYCGRYSSYYGSSGLWVDDFDGYDTFRRYGFTDPCGMWRYMACFNLGPFGSYYSGAYPYCGPQRQQVATNDPRNPILPPATDTTKVNGWAPDSITRPWVDLGTREDLKKPGSMEVEPGRFVRNPVRERAETDDQSYAIPSRALEALRSRRDRGSAQDAPTRAAESAPIRPMGAGAGAETRPMEWVRTPRSFESGSNPEGLSRGSIVRRGMDGNSPARELGGSRAWDAPVRTSSPIFDRGGLPDRSPAGRGNDFPGIRETGYSPPSLNGGYQPSSQGSSSAIDRSPGGPEGRPAAPATESRGGVQSRPSAESRPATGGASTGEKKPPQR